MDKFIVTACLLICISVTYIDVVAAGGCVYIPHCNKCTYDANTQRATCQECDPLFGLTTVNGFSRCLNCSDGTGCLFCKDFTSKCEKCKFPARDGPDNNGQNTCSACGPNCRGCSKAGSGKCDNCQNGARKIGDQCETCDVGNCRKCDEDRATCTRCMDGYFLNNNQCTKCNDPNCRNCLDAGSCITPKDFYFLEKDSKICRSCPENCPTCEDFDHCTRCTMGFFVNNKNTCTQCDDSCLVCTGTDQCTYCRQGRPVDGSCKCAPNCKSCRNLGYGKCDECMEGYSQDQGKKCKKVCPPNCDTCTNQNTCTQCNSGWRLGDDGKCRGLE